MLLSIGRKIALGFAVALAALVSVGLVSYSNLVELGADAQWVTHTLEVLQKTDGLKAGLMRAENTARGYVLTGDTEFRERYQAASRESLAELQALTKLTADNPTQQQRLARAERLLSARLDLAATLMNVRDVRGVDRELRIADMVREGRGRSDELYRLIGEVAGEEQQLLRVRQARSDHTAWLTRTTIVYGTIVAVLLVAAIGFLVTKSITAPLHVLRRTAEKIGAGDYAQRADVTARDEVGELATVFNRMAVEIQERDANQAAQDWLKTSVARLSRLMEGQRNARVLSEKILGELASLLDARHSVLYVTSETDGRTSLDLLASYASDGAPAQLVPGQGLVGQCFVEQRIMLVDDVPPDNIRIASGLGSAKPSCIAVLPSLFEGRVKAVIELASFQRFTPLQLTFLGQLADSLGVVLNIIQAAARTEQLLDREQDLSKSLQAQSEELAEKNQELEAQTVLLRDSERLLQEQQEELKQANEELEQGNEELQQLNEEMIEKANLLAEQKREVEDTNQEIERARLELEDKAAQLAATSRYKSEFLANMSHELRTPLNSLLILSKILADNGEANLTAKQVQFAQTIQSSGNDLLELINDILDLSKIESGAVEIDLGEMTFDDLKDQMEHTFRHVAQNKKLVFDIDLSTRLPAGIATDVRRMQQVIKNLLSNAFKFTETGAVTLRVDVAARGWDPDRIALNEADTVIAFAVIDTGIGIPPDKLNVIFEAFQQADAGTARRFGGTGLGLSISREIARLLGGSLAVQSEEGRGSTFTFYLPAAFRADLAQRSSRRLPVRDAARASAAAPALDTGSAIESVDVELDAVADDRASIVPGDLVLLIIEDDRKFARIMVDFARERRFRVLAAHSAAHGIALANQFLPAAITLDVNLPDNDGWVVLDRLKHDPKTRHIPVHLITVEEQRERALRLGAVSFLQKPVAKEALDGALSQTIEFLQRPIKNLLLVEDDAAQRSSIVELIGNADVHTTAVATAADTLAALKADRFDCVVLDLGLPDMNGTQLIKTIHKSFGSRTPPIIVYTGRELTRQEESELRMISDSIIVKGVRSPERLLDETALFLHRVQARLPEPKRRMIERVQKSDSILAGRKVLVVDDDLRNIFAITSVLESHQMLVQYAESGQAGIDALNENPDIEVVLMDVMMPDMDGLEAIRRIRCDERFRRLPILSVTAKAMKGDREKCLDAGASDYITKPVDMEQLRSLLRVWLYR